MNIDIEQYNNFVSMIENNTLKVEDLLEFNNNYINYITHEYQKQEKKRMLQGLNRGRKILKLFSQIVKRNILAYEVGKLEGVYLTMDKLYYITNKDKKFEEAMLSVTNKANYNDVLRYLYKYPDSQHKVISNELNLNKGYLTQILTELREYECVERNGIGKRSFFKLSIRGENYIKEKAKKNIETNSSDINEILSKKYPNYGSSLKIIEEISKTREIKGNKFDYISSKIPSMR